VSQACEDAVKSFLEKVLGRLTFKRIEELFSRALDQNPVFKEVEKRGAFGKNILIVLGGRGCGKTLFIRYAKYYLTKDGWDFIYVSPQDLGQGQDAERKLADIFEDALKKIEGDSNYKVAIALDDIVEAPVTVLDYIKDFIVPNVFKHAGRLMLIVAAQSERTVGQKVAAVYLLREKLGMAQYAEAFFGENPRDKLYESFGRSYLKGSLVETFRGAALINLDAFWSSLRSLSKVDDLANVIEEIARFYTINSAGSCDTFLNEIARLKRGLALLALSSLPRVVRRDEKIIIEYTGPVGGFKPSDSSTETVIALNGQGIADLLYKFLTDSRVKDLVNRAERVYGCLSSGKGSLEADEVKQVIMDAANLLPDAEARSVPVNALLKPAGGQTHGRGRRLDVDVIAVDLSKEPRFLVLHSLKTDKRGYVTSSSMNKLRKLVGMGIPSEAELRYLIIIAPRKTYEKNVLGVVDMKRLGRDVILLPVDTLDDKDRSLILLLRGALNCPYLDNELLNVLKRIVLGTLTLKLRREGIPHLAFHMLPLAG
jgi:hypothetical protein